MGFQGRCQCGAVQFHVDGDAKWVAYCHCSMCRRAHGAGFVAWVGVRNDQFHVDQGRDGALARYASSREARRSFCQMCGTPMFFQSERWADETHIALGVVDEPHTLKPTAHAFFDDRAAWTHVDDGLPRRGGPSGNKPLP